MLFHPICRQSIIAQEWVLDVFGAEQVSIELVTSHQVQGWSEF